MHIKDQIRFYQDKITNIAESLKNNGEEDFDIVINIFQSWGYYGTDEDIDILRAANLSCPSNAVLIVEPENRDW